MAKLNLKAGGRSSKKSTKKSTQKNKSVGLLKKSVKHFKVQNKDKSQQRSRKTGGQSFKRIK